MGLCRGVVLSERRTGRPEVRARLGLVTRAAQRLHVAVRVLATEGQRDDVVHVDVTRREVLPTPLAPTLAGLLDALPQACRPVVNVPCPGLQRSPSTDRRTGFVGPVVSLAAPSVGGGLGAVATAHIPPPCWSVMARRLPGWTVTNWWP